MATVNGDQVDYWNGDPGAEWIRFQPDLDLLFHTIDARLIQQARPQPGECVLDVGCGAGTTSLAFAHAVHPRGQVIGLDISAAMIRAAQARQGAQDGVTFTLGDAQDFALRPGAFDLAVSRFGVMFFGQPAEALANIRQALRPGGRAVFAVWQGPETNPWFTLPGRAAEQRLGADPPGNPDAPSPLAMRDPARILPMLVEAGFAECRAEPLLVDLHHPGGPAALADLATRIGPAARILQQRGNDEDRIAIVTDLQDMLQPFHTGDGIRLPAGIIIYSALNPR